MGDPERVGIREIAELTARLRALSQAGRAADDAERHQFIVDKERLLARIEAEGSVVEGPCCGHPRPAAQDADHGADGDGDDDGDGR